MDYNNMTIQYMLQPHSKVEDGAIKLLPMSKLTAQDALTDMVLKEIMACKTVSEAREIEHKLRLIAEHTDLETTGYMGQVQATIKILEQEYAISR